MGCEKGLGSAGLAGNKGNGEDEVLLVLWAVDRTSGGREPGTVVGGGAAVSLFALVLVFLPIPLRALLKREAFLGGSGVAGFFAADSARSTMESDIGATPGC